MDLLWPGSGNTRAIGSRLTLHASTGTYLREIRSSSGVRSTLPALAADTLLTVQR